MCPINRPIEYLWTIEIKQHIANYYNISIDNIEEGRRQYPAAEARAICMWMLNEYVYDELNPTPRYTKIGELFSNRDRTTAMEAIKRVNRILEPIKCANGKLITDKRFTRIFDEINEYVQSKIIKHETINC